ncbi:Bet v I type allergen [Parasponia andersonii]|uniref:Bet v I type allergen n=1 Tax=Parasponia andersonii TaxID=3476 RepID=A0A2P5ASM5_PARAD|nr:Bet v I type allergen [Parasponia andersonii]
MAQIAKVEVQVEVKSSAETFYEVYRGKQYLWPKICPDIVKSVKLIKGDWDSIGSVKEWTFVAGNSETAKEMVEAIDEKNKTITLKILDGEAKKHYKNIKTTLQVTGMDQRGSLVKLSMEYEKQNDDTPVPTKYLEAFKFLAKSIDAYLTKNA